MLPVDEAGRLLLVKEVGQLDGWGVLGGAFDAGEGSPALSDGELSDFAWFAPEDLPTLRLGRFARALLRATGHL